jgi:Putative nucleotidyltransferase substrate binding domain/Putative nucleotidyltransferase DUF294
MPNLLVSFNTLLAQIKGHYEAGRYHWLLDNLDFAISMLDKWFAKNDLSADMKGMAQQLVELCSVILPMLDRQAQEWQFREHLYLLAMRLNEGSQKLGLIVGDKLLKKVPSKYSIHGRNTYEKKYHYHEWQAIPDERFNQIGRLQQALQSAITRENQIEVVLNCLFDTAFPYVLVGAKQNPQTSLAYLRSCQELIEKLLPHLSTCEDQSWHVVHLYYFFYAEFQAGHLPCTIRQHFDEIEKLLIKGESSIVLLQRCRLSIPACSSVDDWQALLDKLITINGSIPVVYPVLPISLLDDYPKQLEKARNSYSNQPAIAAQKAYTTASLAILRQLLADCIVLLGTPPCAIALLALGSTSREDRMPYSDLELALLHSDEDINLAQIRAYTTVLLRLLELTILCFNETPLPNVEDCRGGFRIDSSTHVLAHPDLIGSPEKVFTQKVGQLANSCELIDSESIYSLLQPILINPEGMGLFSAYQQRVNIFLQKSLPPLVMQKLRQRWLPQQIVKSGGVPFTYRQATALFCLLDVLKKSQQEIHAQEIDIKKAYYKPLVYFCLSLRLYYQLAGKHPREMLQAAYDRSLLPIGFFKLVSVALETILALRIRLHLETRRQQEKVDKKDLTTDEQFSLEIIFHGVIKPLHDQLETYLTHDDRSSELKEVFVASLKAYLMQSKSWYRQANGCDLYLMLNLPDQKDLVNYGNAYIFIKNDPPQLFHTSKNYIFKATLPNTTVTIEFEEQEIKPDRDCGFTALRVDRKALADKLLSLKNNAQDREFLSEEILKAFDTYKITGGKEGLKPDKVYVALLQERGNAHENLDKLCRPTEDPNQNNFPKLFSSENTIPSLLGKMPNNDTQTEFEEHFVPPDGNCGFTTLGVERQELVGVLLSLENDLSARMSLAEVIENALRSQEIEPPDTEGQNLMKAVYDEQDNLDKLFRKTLDTLTDETTKRLECDQLITWLQNNNRANQAQALIECRLAVHQAERKLEVYCQSQAVFLHYIQSFVDADLWLDYESALLYAKQTNTKLYIWKKEENNSSQLTLIKYHEVTDNANTTQNEIHMLFTGGFTHFNLLSIKEYTKEPLIKLQQSKISSEADQKTALIEQRLKISQAEGELLKYHTRPEIFEYYVKSFCNTFSDRPLRLGYKSALLYAKQMNIALYIWRKSEIIPNQLELITHQEGMGGTSNEIHMLHTHGFTHFNLLRSKNIPLSKILKLKIDATALKRIDTQSIKDELKPLKKQVSDEILNKFWEIITSNEGHARVNHKQLPLLQVLAEYPTPEGWSPRAKERKLTWLLTVQTALCHTTPSSCRIESPFWSDRYLPSSITDELLEPTGELRQDVSVSSPASQVKHVRLSNEQDFHFKCRLDHPTAVFGQEYAVAYLYEILGGVPVPSLLVKLRGEAKNGKPYTHWVWVSKTVLGETLAKTMVRNPHRLRKLDQHTYSQLFILALLTCPEDGQPENFILQGPNTQGLYYLHSIDNGQAFVNACHKEGFITQSSYLDIKTMLYVLNDVNRPLSPIIGEQLKLLDVNRVVSTWKSRLEKLNRSYRPLLEDTLRASPIPQHEYSKYNQLITLPENTIEGVRLRLQRLQTLCNTLDITTQTYWDILKAVDPKLAILYSRFIGNIKQPEDYYHLNPKAYTRDHGRVYSTTTVRQLEDRRQSPIQLRETMGLDITFFESLNFSYMEKTQQCFYFAMMQELAFTSLELSNCSELTDSIFESLLKASPYLQTISLTNCSNNELTGKSWDNINYYCKNITAIYFNDIPSVKCLNWNNLHKLAVLSVQNSASLTSIVLKKSSFMDKISFWKMPYPELTEISIHNCPQLQELKIDCINLKNFEVKNCTMLSSLCVNTDEKIKAILEAINLNEDFIELLRQDLRLSKISWDNLTLDKREWIRSMMQDENGDINFELLDTDHELRRLLGILIPIFFDKKKCINSLTFSFYGIKDELESFKLTLRKHPNVLLLEMDHEKYDYSTEIGRNRFWHVLGQNEANLNSTSSSSTHENSGNFVKTPTPEPNLPVTQNSPTVFSLYDPLEEFINKYNR